MNPTDTNQHSKCDDCYKTHLPEAHDRTILPSEAFSEGYVPEFNQASEDKPTNQHLVCLWRLQDIEETIADASPEELVDLHPKLVALSTDITEAVQSAIRTEKLKLLAEVRERVMGEGDFVDAEILKKLYDKAYSNGYNDKGYESLYNSQDYRSAEDIAPVIAKIRGGYDKRSAALTKLEAEL